MGEVIVTVGPDGPAVNVGNAAAIAAETANRVAADATEAAARSAADATHAGDHLVHWYESNTAPTSPVVGFLWLDTSTTPSTPKRWTGTAWETLAGTGGGGGATAAGLTANCLNFPRVTAPDSVTVDHGVFFLDGPMGFCLWEAWLMPRQADTRYWISDSYGGGHNVLAGFNYGTSGPETGINSPQGNVWREGVGAVGWVADPDEGLYNGEWGHTSWSWDGTDIYAHVNGIPVCSFPFTGVRSTAGLGSGPPTLYIGGSDHQNFDGRLAMVRGFEGGTTSSPGSGVYIPDFPFGLCNGGFTDANPASFLANYMTPSAILIPDLSPGFNGETHPGRLRNPSQRTGIQSPEWVNDPTMPFQSAGLVLPVEKTWSAPATPTGATDFDSFSRRNQTYAFQAKPTLGSTEGGSEGVKTWLPTPPGAGVQGWFGIFAGRAVPLAPGGTCVQYVLGATANMEVRVSRKGATNRAGKSLTGLAFRVVDPGNPTLQPTSYWYVYEYNGNLNLGNTTDGLLITSAAIPNATWVTVRVVATGTSISLYVDNGAGGWTQVGTTQTSTRFQTATGRGLYSINGSGLSRFDNFTALAA